jgi:hypothetical protein
LADYQSAAGYQPAPQIFDTLLAVVQNRRGARRSKWIVAHSATGSAFMSRTHGVGDAGGLNAGSFRHEAANFLGGKQLEPDQGRQGKSDGMPSGGRLQSKGSTSLPRLGLADRTVKDDSATNSPADASATNASIIVYSRRYLRMDAQASYRQLSARILGFLDFLTTFESRQLPGLHHAAETSSLPTEARVSKERAPATSFDCTVRPYGAAPQLVGRTQQ